MENESYERWMDVKKLKKQNNCYFCKKKINLFSDFQPFCSIKCTKEYKIRSSHSFLISETLKRDRGRCNICGIDTLKCKKIITRIKNDKDSISELIKHWGFNSKTRFWEADHIIPVFRGGGSCGLENIQTLCYNCHKEKTKEELSK